MNAVMIWIALVACVAWALRTMRDTWAFKKAPTLSNTVKESGGSVPSLLKAGRSSDLASLAKQANLTGAKLSDNQALAVAKQSMAGSSLSKAVDSLGPTPSLPEFKAVVGRLKAEINGNPVLAKSVQTEGLPPNLTESMISKTRVSPAHMDEWDKFAKDVKVSWNGAPLKNADKVRWADRWSKYELVLGAALLALELALLIKVLNGISDGDDESDNPAEESDEASAAARRDAAIWVGAVGAVLVCGMFACVMCVAVSLYQNKG